MNSKQFKSHEDDLLGRGRVSGSLHNDSVNSNKKGSYRSDNYAKK